MERLAGKRLAGGRKLHKHVCATWGRRPRVPPAGPQILALALLSPGRLAGMVGSHFLNSATQLDSTICREPSWQEG